MRVACVQEHTSRAATLLTTFHHELWGPGHRCTAGACCAETSVRYFGHCPVCKKTVATSDKSPISVASVALLKNTVQREEAQSDLSLTRRLYDVQRLRLAALIEQRQGSRRIVLEYGNSAAIKGSKTTYVNFLRIYSMDEGAGGESRGKRNGKLTTPTESSLIRVDFNINPGFAKPT